jgi:hypothetical protein
LSPLVDRFIACARDVAKSIGGRPASRTAPQKKSNVS